MYSIHRFAGFSSASTPGVRVWLWQAAVLLTLSWPASLPASGSFHSVDLGRLSLRHTMASSASYWSAYLLPIIVSSPMLGRSFTPDLSGLFVSFSVFLLAFYCLSSLLVRFDLELSVSGVFRWSARLNTMAASFRPVTWVTFLLLSHMSSSSFSEQHVAMCCRRSVIVHPLSFLLFGP